MTSGSDVSRMYRDFHVKSALVAEKERSVAAKRAALAELRQQVEAAERDCQDRQVPLSHEMSKLNRAKEECTAVRAERDRALRVQQARISELKDEESMLQRSTQQLVESINRASERVSRARHDAADADAITSAVEALRVTVESEEASIEAHAAQVAQLTRSCETRREAAQLRQLPLPTEPAACCTSLPEEGTVVFFDAESPAHGAR